jgi:predicted alpha/beta hydrolase family esterase
MKCDILILSGLWNSGPDHWQTRWQQRYPAWAKVQHRDWNNPQRDEWVDELDAAVAACEGRPILVAHSLGCILAVQWARSASQLKVAGAFLVAPSDTEAASFPIADTTFKPIPFDPLPFPSMVITSSNDPYVTSARSRAFAAAWGSHLVEVGPAGHINDASGHGPWPQGEAMLEEFCRALTP